MKQLIADIMAEIARLAVDHPDFYDELKREAGVNEDMSITGIPGRGA